jgi:hypothetical protein
MQSRVESWIHKVSESDLSLNGQIQFISNESQEWNVGFLGLWALVKGSEWWHINWSL